MISTIKDLEKLLKLCRKQGVNKITLGDVAIELGDLALIPVTQAVSLNLIQLIHMQISLMVSLHLSN